MDAAIVASIVGALVVLVFGTIGYLIRSLITDIRNDLRMVRDDVKTVREKAELTERHQSSILNAHTHMMWRLFSVEDYLEDKLEYRPLRGPEPPF